MTRRRWIQDRETGELIEVTPDYRQEPRDTAKNRGALYNDRSYEGLRATDGTDISSRSRHRAYMKANNLTTVDDFKETWAKAQQERESFHTQGGSIKRQDIERAMYQVLNNRR